MKPLASSDGAHVSRGVLLNKHRVVNIACVGIVLSHHKRMNAMRRVSTILCLPLVMAVAVSVGCDGESLRVSVTHLDFGDTQHVLAFEVYNGNPNRRNMEAALDFDGDWLSLEPTRVVSAAPESEDGPFDSATVQARLDRTALAGGPAEGRIEITGRGLKKQTVTVRALPPYEAIELSTPALNFGINENALELTVRNINTRVSRLDIVAHTDSAWIDINRTAVVSQGLNDPKTIVVGIKRSRLTGGQYNGRVIFEAEGFTPKVLDVSVIHPYQAIMVSNQLLDFGFSTRPQLIDVWNGNKNFDAIHITATASHSWIEVTPAAVTSQAPVTAIDPVSLQPVTTFDKQQMLVTINRAGLGPGNYEASIELRSDTMLIAPRIVVVKVRQETGTPDTEGLLIERPAVHYSSPYLVDFAFGLAWNDGSGFVAEPEQLRVTAIENNKDVTGLVLPILHRGAARQLRAEIVMDYAFGMRANPDAMAAMEHAAGELFLPALPKDGLVGLSLYYRDNLDPLLLAPFTVDHTHVAEHIHHIQSDVIGSWSSGARMFDALRRAVIRFDLDNVAQEERFILLLAGTDDTSSVETADRVVNAARRRQVKIHAVNFLNDGRAAATMLDLAVRTGGVYLPAGAIEQLPEVIGRITDRLESNYLLRWATLERANTLVTPAFVVSWDDYAAKYTAHVPFNPVDIEGNVLEGRLRLIDAGSSDNAAVLLRLEYTPRMVSRIRLLISAALPFDVAPAAAADGGLIEHWDIWTVEDVDAGLTAIEMVSPDGSALPFATFGALILLDFEGVPGEGEPLIHEIEVDNSIPEYDNDRFFTIVY